MSVNTGPNGAKGGKLKIKPHRDRSQKPVSMDKGMPHKGNVPGTRGSRSRAAGSAGYSGGDGYPV